VGDLKKLVWEKGKQGTLRDVDVKDLVLFKAGAFDGLASSISRANTATAQ